MRRLLFCCLLLPLTWACLDADAYEDRDTSGAEIADVPA